MKRDETSRGASPRPAPSAEPVEATARAIVDRGLGVHAVFLLECLRPFSFLGGQFLLAVDPLARMIGARAANLPLAELLADRDRVEALLRRIEAHETERDA